MGLLNWFREEPPSRVDRAVPDVQVMLRKGHRMFVASAACVLDNEILDLDLGAVNGEIDQCEQRLRRLILEHLTVDPRHELVFSLKLLDIIHEAACIGDLARSLEKTGRLAHKPRLGRRVEPLRDVRDRILSMFNRAREGFVESDRAAARTLLIEHETMQEDVAHYLMDLAQREAITANEGIVYALSARLMSRVGAHLSNIAAMVVSTFDQIARPPLRMEEGRRVGEVGAGTLR